MRNVAVPAFTALGVCVRPYARPRVSCCSADKRDVPTFVESDLVLISSPARSAAGPSAKVLAAVVGRSSTDGRALVLPVVRRHGAEENEAWVEHGADEEDEAVLDVVEDAEWSCRQMTIDNPHGEAVEDVVSVFRASCSVSREGPDCTC